MKWKQRNSQRKGKKNIPLFGILDTYKKLEIPSYEEGFDRLFYVKIDIDRLFIVESQPDAS